MITIGLRVGMKLGYASKRYPRIDSVQFIPEATDNMGGLGNDVK